MELEAKLHDVMYIHGEQKCAGPLRMSAEMDIRDGYYKNKNETIAIDKERNGAYDFV